MGPLVEYSKSADKIILLFSLSITVIKFITGALMLKNSVALSINYTQVNTGLSMQVWFWLKEYQEVPLEVFFAAAESVKFIQIVFLAQWLDKKRVVIYVGGWFMLLGASNAIHSTVKNSADF